MDYKSPLPQNSRLMMAWWWTREDSNRVGCRDFELDHVELAVGRLAFGVEDGAETDDIGRAETVDRPWEQKILSEDQEFIHITIRVGR